MASGICWFWGWLKNLFRTCWNHIKFFSYAGASNDTKWSTSWSCGYLDIQNAVKVQNWNRTPKKLEWFNVSATRSNSLGGKAWHWTTLLQGTLMSHLAKLVRQFDYFIGLEMSEQPFGLQILDGAVVSGGSWLVAGGGFSWKHTLTLSFFFCSP